MVMKIEPKDDDIELVIKDEIDTLTENITIVANLLKSVEISFLTAKNAQKLLEILIKIKNISKDKNEKIEKKVAIIQKLPLLYLQSNFIKKQIKLGVKV